MSETLRLTIPRELLKEDRFEITRNLGSSQAVIVIPIAHDLSGVYWRPRDEAMTFPSGKAGIETDGPDAAARQEINHEAGYKGKNLFATYGVFTIKNVLQKDALTMGVYAALIDRDTILRPRKDAVKETLQKVEWDRIRSPHQFAFSEHYYAAQLVRANLDEVVHQLHTTLLELRRDIF